MSVILGGTMVSVILWVRRHIVWRVCRPIMVERRLLAAAMLVVMVRQCASADRPYVKTVFDARVGDVIMSTGRQSRQTLCKDCLHVRTDIDAQVGDVIIWMGQCSSEDSPQMKTALS